MFFAIFLAVVGLQLTFKVITKGWLWNNVQLMYLLSYSLPLLIGPSIYLFIRSRRNIPLKRMDSLHAVPFTLLFLNTLLGESFGFYFLHLGLPYPALDLISLYAYGIASWKFIDSAPLKSFLLLTMISETVILITIAFMIRNIETFPDVRWLFITLTLLIYWISYKILTDPNLFAQQAATASFKPDTLVKYAHSGLKADEADRIESLLCEMIYNQQVFLDPSISIESLATRLNVPKHHLSRVINERFKKKFNDLANDWRLEEVRSRLADPKYRALTISTIAFDCGFSSVPSFNAMFRRRYQTTPSMYRQLNLGEMTA